MKANKALKRLSKVEALIANVTERLSPREPHVRAVLDDLRAAFDRVKEAVSAQASSLTSNKKARVQSPKPVKDAAPAPSGASKNKKSALKTSAPAKQRVTSKTAGRKTTAKKTAPKKAAAKKASRPPLTQAAETPDQDAAVELRN